MTKKVFLKETVETTRWFNSLVMFLQLLIAAIMLAIQLRMYHYI
ncbi:hypothetical protein [Carboxylicivirga sp. RSCT41]